VGLRRRSRTPRTSLHAPRSDGRDENVHDFGRYEPASHGHNGVARGMQHPQRVQSAPDVDSGPALAHNQGVGAFRHGVLAGLLVAGLAGPAMGQGRAPWKRRDARPPPEPPAAEAETGQCKPMPAKAKVKVSLKPETEVADVIAWFSGLTCTPLVVSSAVPVAGKKVTILSPRPITRKELDGLFLGALDSVGLTIERDGRFFYVIESAKARHHNMPVELSQ
jgi:hypothetical protein